MNNDNIYVKLAKARSMFLSSGAKKSGENKFAKFNYFELEDIIPQKTAIFEKLGLVDMVNFYSEQKGDSFFDVAELTLINSDKPEETITFRTPVAYDGKGGSNAIQTIGSVHTYFRRYLYLLCLDICECDEINATIGKPAEGKKEEKKGASNHPEYAELMDTCKAYAEKHNTTVDKTMKAIGKTTGKPLTYDTVEEYLKFIKEVSTKGEQK